MFYSFYLNNYYDKLLNDIPLKSFCNSANMPIDSLSGSNHNKQNSVVLNLDGSNVVKTFSQNNDFCNQLNANGPVCVACGVLECMCGCLDTVQSGANFAMSMPNPWSDLQPCDNQVQVLHTNQHLKCYTGKVESHAPLQMSPDSNYPVYTNLELFVEFVNLLRGKLRQDAYKYLVQNSKHQITVDPNAPNADFTYNQKDLTEMSKYVQSGLDENELDEVLRGLPNIEMSFIERDMTDISTLNVSDKEFTRENMTESSEDYDFVDLQKQAQSTLKNFFNKSTKDVTRFPGYCHVNSILSIWEFVADSGANCSLLSKNFYLKMGGQMQDIKGVSKNCVIENTSQGLSTQQILGLAQIKIHTLVDNKPSFVGLANFIVINVDFNEILLGTDFLSGCGFVLSYEMETPFIQLDCYRDSGRQVKAQFLINQPLDLAIFNDKEFSLNEGNQIIDLKVPITGRKEIVSLNSTLYVIAKLEIQTKNFVFVGPRKIKYDDFFTSFPFEIYSSKKQILNPHKIRIPISLGSKSHCIKVLSNLINIPKSGTVISNGGELVKDEDKKFICGFPVLDQNVDGLLDSGIDPDLFQGDQDLDLSHLDPDLRKRFHRIHNKYSGVFSTKSKPLGKFTGKIFSLPIEGKAGPHDKPLRHPPQQMEEILKMCDDFIRIGVLEESESKSEYNHRVFLVGKHNSKSSKADFLQNTEKTFSAMRLVNDLRPLNKLIRVSGSNPLPDPNALLTNLHGKHVICMDLKLAYYCLELDRESQEKQSFYVGGRTFRLKKAGMGYILSSSWLDQALSMVFNETNWQGYIKDYPSLQSFGFYELVFIFADDIVIHALDKENAILTYEYILAQLHKFGFKLEKKKLNIFSPVCNILGQRVKCESSGYKVFGLLDHKKLEMKDWPVPSSRRALLSRMACISAQIRLLPGIKHILQFFYVFLRGESLIWTPLLDRMWKVLMLVVQLTYDLQSIDPNKPLLIFSDSSIVSCASFLAQVHEENGKFELKVCGVSGRVYSKDAKNQSSVSKELSSILTTIKDFENAIRNNVHGTYIISDCKAVLYCQRAVNSNLTFSRAAIFLSSFANLRFIHFPGLALRCVDLYSRLFEKGFQEVQKFDKNRAQKIPVHIFSDGEQFSMALIDKIAQALPNCSFTEISRISRQKVNLKDIACSLQFEPFESEFIRGILGGYEQIKKEHPVWRLAKNDKNSVLPPTKKEFEKFMENKDFVELRQCLLNNKDMFSNKLILNYNFQSIQNLLGCEYFVWINLKNINGYYCNTRLNLNTAMVEFKMYKYEKEKVFTLEIQHNCVKKLYISAQCGIVDTILESSNENLFSFQIKLQGVRGIPATMVFFITLDQKKVNFKQVSGDLQSPKIVTTLGTMPHSENEPQLQVKSAPKNNMITHFCNSFLANFNNLENDKIPFVNISHCESQLTSLFNNSFVCYSTNDTESGDDPKDVEEDDEIDCQNLSSSQIRDLKFKRSLVNVNQLLYVSNCLLKGERATSKLFVEIQKSDEFIQKVRDGVERKDPKFRKFYISKNNLVFEKKKISNFNFFVLCVPKWFLALLIRSLHTGHYHVTSQALFRLLSTCLSSPNMLGIIASETRNCLSCIFGQTSLRKNIAGDMRSERSNIVGASWFVDYLESLPASLDGFTNVWVAVCAASSFCFAVPVRSININTSNFCLRLLLSLFPRVSSIHTDGSIVFKQYGDIMKAAGGEHYNSTSRSVSQGQVENSVKLIRSYLSKILVNIDTKYRHRWSDVLHLCVSTINSQILQANKQPFSRAGLFFKGLANQSLGSPISLKEVEKSLDLLNNHRDNLLVDKSRPPSRFSVGDIVVFRRKKLEINPDSTGYRALIPPVIKVYKIVETSPMYAKCLSLSDHQVVRIAKNKLDRLQVDEYLQLNASSIGLSKFVNNMATKGVKDVPEFFNSKDIFGPRFTDVENHIKSCKQRNCPLIKKAKVYSLPPDGELNNEIFGISKPRLDQSQTVIQEPEPSPVDIAPLDGGIEMLYDDFLQEEMVTDEVRATVPAFNPTVQPPMVDNPIVDLVPRSEEILDLVPSKKQPKLKVAVVQDTDTDEMRDIGQITSRFQPSRDLTSRIQRKAKGAPQNLLKRKGNKTDFTILKCNRNYFFDRYQVLTPLTVFEVQQTLKSRNPDKGILKTKKKTNKRQNRVKFSENIYLLKFFTSFSVDSQVVVLRKLEQ